MSKSGIDLVVKDFCVNLSEKYPNHFRVAFNEKDDSKDFDAEANEFLKMDEFRLGRDFKVYGFMQQIESSQMAIADFAHVLMEIKYVYPDIFNSVKERVDDWKNFFDENMQEDWINMWRIDKK